MTRKAMQNQRKTEHIVSLYDSQLMPKTPNKQKNSPSFTLLERESIWRDNGSCRKKRNRDRTYSVEASTHFQISASHLGFLIEQQKNAELAQLDKQKNKDLNQYYLKLKYLFSQFYNASHQMKHQVYQSKEEMIDKLIGRDLLEIVLGVEKWDNQSWIKLKILTQNIMHLEANRSTFEDKIQFVCRRIALNINKSMMIKGSLTNQKALKYWDHIKQQIKKNSSAQSPKLKIIEVIKAPPQILALYDFQQFINRHLAKETFIQKFNQRTTKHKLDQIQKQYIPQFSFEFVFIELFCLGDWIKSEEIEEMQTNYRQMCQLI